MLAYLYFIKDIDELITKYVSSLEHIVELYPYQWFNYFDFWSEQVSGAKAK